jgi:hypothetical protein
MPSPEPWTDEQLDRLAQALLPIVFGTEPPAPPEPN